MWQLILKACRARGYTGDDTLEAVQAWLAAQPKTLEFTDPATGKTADIAKAFADRDTKAKAVEAVTLDSEDDAEEDADTVTLTQDEYKALKAAEKNARRHKAGARMARVESDFGGGYSSPAVYDIAKSRKSYEAKAWGHKAGQRRCQSFDDAVTMGALFKGVMDPNSLRADEWDLFKKTQTTTTFTASGAFIPDDLSATIIDLKEKYGVIRQEVGVTPMSRDTLKIPRRTSGITAYAPGEGTAPTASDPAVDQVQLTATKFMTESKVTSELMNDSLVDIGNFVTGEIAQCHALNEDTICIQGDGLSTMYGFLGLSGDPDTAATKGGKWLKILTDGGGTWATDNANLAGQVVGAGAYSALTLANFLEVVGRLPAYVYQRSTPRWLVHTTFYWNVMRRLALAQGGSTAAEVIQGDPANPTFLGFPVKFSQVMPSVTAVAQVCALFGGFELGCKFGEVRGSMQIKVSDQKYIAEDMIAFYSMERVAFTAHDLGNYSATAASRVPGPIISLTTALS